MEKSSGNGLPGMRWSLRNTAYFATDGKNFYISCSSMPGKLYMNQETNTLIVWFDEIDKDKAIDIFAQYTYYRINPEIRTSKSFRKIVNKNYIDSVVPKV